MKNETNIEKKIKVEEYEVSKTGLDGRTIRILFKDKTIEEIKEALEKLI